VPSHVAWRVHINLKTGPAGRLPKLQLRDASSQACARSSRALHWSICGGFVRAEKGPHCFTPWLHRREQGEQLLCIPTQDLIADVHHDCSGIPQCCAHAPWLLAAGLQGRGMLRPLRRCYYPNAGKNKGRRDIYTFGTRCPMPWLNEKVRRRL
jgi:hypothetical protein